MKHKWYGSDSLLHYTLFARGSIAEHKGFIRHASPDKLLILILVSLIWTIMDFNYTKLIKTPFISREQVPQSG